MNRLQKKYLNMSQRKKRVRSRVYGTSSRPRLSVFISKHHVSAQLINDDAHHTIASASTVGRGDKLTGTMTDKAIAIGHDIAKKAKKHKVSEVVFDRNGRLYHGRVKALAEAARKEGLEF